MDAYEPDRYDEWADAQMHAHHAITPHWAAQEAAYEGDEDPFDLLHQPPCDPWADSDGVATADAVIDRWFDHLRY